MINVGEQLVSSYLRYIKGCEFIQTNIQTSTVQGEIDVLGINLKKKEVYFCEVAIHLTTGLQYVKDKRPNNVNKLTEKLTKNIAYANAYFPAGEYARHFLIWSPIAKRRLKNPQYDQVGHLTQVQENIKEATGEEIGLYVNERFQQAINELRKAAGGKTEELKCPIMRFMQVEHYLRKHLEKEV